jgi:hypothetical protein
MSSSCSLCSKTEARSDCYVRFESDERPACRPCWEQLILDPRRILRALRGEETSGSPNPSAS